MFPKSRALLEQEAAERRARSGITLLPLQPEGPGSLLRPGETIFDPSKQSEFQSFGEGMGEILGNLTDKFGLYQSAINEAGVAFGAFIRGQASFGQAMKQAAKNVISSIGSRAFIEAIYHTAQGIAASIWNPGVAAKEFAAAAQFAATAPAAGLAGRAIGGGGGGGGGGGFGGPGSSPLNPIFVDPFAQSNQFRLQDVNVTQGNAHMQASLDVIAASVRGLGTAPADHVVTAGIEAAGGIPALLTGGDLRTLTQEVVNDSRI